MDNNFNQNGQFGGWERPDFSGGAQTYNDFYLKYAEKSAQKNELKKVGKRCGLAVIMYLAISYGLSLVIIITSWIFPSISKVYEDVVPSLAFDIILSLLSIGVPFFIVQFLLKKDKLVETMPFGTTYNREAATSLVMICLPIMVFSAVGINSISSFFQELLGIEFTSTVSDMSLKGVGGTLFGTLSIAVVPAIIEEMAIRGIVMQSLRKYGDAFAIVVSAMFFACMHGNMVQIPYTIIGGLLLGYLAIATGSLWPSIILHFLNNFYSVIIVSASDNFSDNASVAVALVMFVIFIVVGLLGAIKYSKLKYKVSFSKSAVALTLKEKLSAFLGNGPMITAIIFLGIITLSNIKF